MTDRVVRIEYGGSSVRIDVGDRWVLVKSESLEVAKLAAMLVSPAMKAYGEARGVNLWAVAVRVEERSWHRANVLRCEAKARPWCDTIVA